MNDLIKKYFSEEEFNEINSNKNGEPYMRKVLFTRNVSHTTQWPRKDYPGGPLLRNTESEKEEDDIVLIRKYHKSGPKMWILVMSHSTHGTDGIPPFEWKNDWLVINNGSRKKVYLGVGNEYGKLKKLSESDFQQTKKPAVGEVYEHFNGNGFIYITGHKNDLFTCEMWNYNAGFSGFSGTDGVSKKPKGYYSYLEYVSHQPYGDPGYYKDVLLTEDEILNMYFFFKEVKMGSTNLNDYIKK